MVHQVHMEEQTPTTDEIVHAADIELVERRILQLALERTNSRNGALFLWEERERVLRLDTHVVEGVEISLPEVHMRRRTDGRPNGIAFHVAESNLPYLSNDTGTDPHYARYFLDVKSVAAVPIPYQDRAIGVISVSSIAPNAYAERDLAELEALAASSAKFLRRAQHYRRGKRTGGKPMVIKGLSPEWLQVEELIERVSPTDAPILVRGESGTGKELVAHAIHFNSRRAERPFVTINCAAIPEQLLESTLFGHAKGAFTGAEFAKTGEFEKADGGTLFLDELGELTPILQAKVLRAIELGEIQPLGSNEPPRHVDVRVIAATNRDLESMRRDGSFRDDLYFRIAVVTISVPPLRSYLDNLEVLCQVLVTQANRTYGREITGIEPDALALLRSHSFPGNVRELRNHLDRAVLVTHGATICAADLSPSTVTTDRGKRSDKPRRRPRLSELRKAWIAERERYYLAQVLEEVSGDVRAAAEILDVDRTTLYRLLKRRGIQLRKQVVQG